MRLFVALPVPPDTRSALAEWMKRCGRQPALRWTPEEQLHITLHFLGEVAEERVGDLMAALDVVHAREFDVEFDRVEVLGRAAVLAASAKLTPQLVALEVDVRTRVHPFGENPDAGREFHPHVTLARARRGVHVPKLSAFPALPKLAFQASCFRLFRSDLRPEGAVHTVIKEWTLAS